MSRTVQRNLNDNQIRCAVFRSVRELIAAMGEYIDRHIESHKRFIWTLKAHDILEKVKRARIAFHTQQPA